MKTRRFLLFLALALAACITKTVDGQSHMDAPRIKRGDTVYASENGFSGTVSYVDFKQLRDAQSGWDGLSQDEIEDKVRLLGWMYKSGIAVDVKEGTRGIVLQVDRKRHEVPWLEVKMDGYDRPIWTEATHFSLHPPGAKK